MTIGNYPSTTQQRDFRDTWEILLERDLVEHDNKQNRIKQKVEKEVVFLCGDPFHDDGICSEPVRGRVLLEDVHWLCAVGPKDYIAACFED